MKVVVGFLVAFPGIASAQDWTPLRETATIRDALADQTLVYDAHSMQYFGAAGTTQHITERVSDGRWAARSGQYCSVWPPSDLWACYDIQISGDRVKFIGLDRSESVGTYRKKR